MSTAGIDWCITKSLKTPLSVILSPEKYWLDSLFTTFGNHANSVFIIFFPSVVARIKSVLPKKLHNFHTWGAAAYPPPLLRTLVLTEFFLLRFMAQAQSARALMVIDQRGQKEDPQTRALRTEKTRLVRYLLVYFYCVVTGSGMISIHTERLENSDARRKQINVRNRCLQQYTI